MGVGDVYAPHAQMVLWLSYICDSKVQDSSSGVEGGCVVGGGRCGVTYHHCL